MIDKKDLRIPDYLDHMREAIARIETYTHGFTLQTFCATAIVRDAVERNFMTIGEAAANIDQLDKTFWVRHPNVEFQKSYVFRNKVAHGYFDVDPVIVWAIVQKDIPAFKEGVAALIELYPPQPGNVPAPLTAEEHLRAKLDRAGEKEPGEASPQQERPGREPPGGGRG